VRFPVVIRLHGSRILPAAVIGAAVLAVLSLMAWLPDLTKAWAAVPIVGLVAGLALMNQRSAPSALMFLADGTLQVADRPDGPFLHVTILPGGIAHPWLTIMRYRRDAAKAERIIVAVDSLSGDDFRRLRILLRGRTPVSDRGGAP
jgi:hypothetical protein